MNNLIVLGVLVFIIILKHYYRENFGGFMGNYDVGSYYNPFYQDYYQAPWGAFPYMNDLGRQSVYPPAYQNMFHSDINDRYKVYGQTRPEGARDYGYNF